VFANSVSHLALRARLALRDPPAHRVFRGLPDTEDRTVVQECHRHHAPLPTILASDAPRDLQDVRDCQVHSDHLAEVGAQECRDKEEDKEPQARGVHQGLREWPEHRENKDRQVFLDHLHFGVLYNRVQRAQLAILECLEIWDHRDTLDYLDCPDPKAHPVHQECPASSEPRDSPERPEVLDFLAQMPPIVHALREHLLIWVPDESLLNQLVYMDSYYMHILYNKSNVNRWMNE